MKIGPKTLWKQMERLEARTPPRPPGRRFIDLGTLASFAPPPPEVDLDALIAMAQEQDRAAAAKGRLRRRLRMG